MDAVVALLRYVAPQAQPLHTYAYDPPDGAPRFNGTLVEHAMSIHDARGLDQGTEFQGLGFTLTEHRSDVVHFDSDRQVIDIGYPEAEMLVRRVAGRHTDRRSTAWAVRSLRFASRSVACTPTTRRCRRPSGSSMSLARRQPSASCEAAT